MIRTTVTPRSYSAGPARGRLRRLVQELIRLMTFAAVVALVVPASMQAQQEPSVNLTPEERAWLAENTIRVGPAPNYPPMEFFDETGAYQGIVADYVAVFEQRLGVQFEIVQYPAWNDVVEAMKAGDIDVWMEAADTEERREYLLFTEPYLRLPVAILVRQEDFEQITVEDLAGRRTAAVEGYATIDYLRERVPGIDIVEVPSVAIGLERLSFGGVDALVAATATADFYSNELGITGLRVAGTSGFEWRLAIGSRKDNPILHEILRKTLDSIDPAERRALYRGWVTIGEGSEPVSAIPPWAIALLALIGVAVLVMAASRGSTTRVSLSGTSSSWPMYLFATFALGAVVGLTWWAEGRITDRMREDVGDALQTVLNTTNQAVYQWFAERENETRAWAGYDEVEQVCRALLAENTGSAQRESSRRLLGEQLAGHMAERRYLGFQLAGPSGEILSSSHPVGTGLKGAIESLRRAATASSSGSAAGLPMPADAEAGSEAAHASFLLVGAEVSDELGSDCLLVFEIDPELEFTRILQRGRIGESGESYAFNSDGRMISDSRFVEDLRRIGLLEDDQSAILAIEVRDPGDNMVTGFRPSVSRSEQSLTRMTEAAIGGRAGSDVSGYRDYRGVPVVGAWTWDETMGFGVVTEIDVAEAFESLIWVRRLLLGGALLVIALILTLTLTFRASENRRRRDIKDLQSAHEELASVGSAICRWGRDGNVVYLNEFGLNLFGFSEEEIIGQSQVGTFVPDTEETRRSIKAMTDGIVDHPDKFSGGEYENITKSGEFIWMAWQNKPILHEDGSLKEILCIGIDITERKLMERELEVARLRMEDELNVGREIQMSMLPLTFPAFPQRHDFSVYATLVPAREVGGDFYDFFLIDDKHFCFCVGDVSGKGVPAALFMAVTKSLIQSRASGDLSPGSVMAHVNDEICRNNDASMFVTVFLGILSVDTGDFVYTNAGHNPPYIKRQNGSVVRIDERHGPVIGAMGGINYGEGSDHLELSDLLLMFTDGVTEAMNGQKQLYGDDRLVELIESIDHKSAEVLVKAVAESVAVFESGVDQADDVTLLGIQYFGAPVDGSLVVVLQIDVENRLEEIARVNLEFNEFSVLHSIPVPTRRSMNLVFDELLNNIVSYAFEDEEPHVISIRIELAGHRLGVTIRDDGTPFDPFARAAPDTTLSVEDREIGGLGLLLVSKVMDEVTYARLDNKNVVTLVKYLAADD